MEYYSVFVNKAGEIPDDKYNELIERCIEISKLFEIPEFKNSKQALKYVYDQESKFPKDMNGKKPLKEFCASFISKAGDKKVFNLYVPNDEHFYTFLEGHTIYCETNRKSYDAIIKILMFLLSRYSNGFYSHDGEQLDYFIECLENYNESDRSKYLEVLEKLTEEFDLKKFGLKK